MTNGTFMDFWKTILRRLLTTNIQMRRHVEFQKTSERDNFYTYWRLHIPMLLNQMKKKVSKKNINSNNTSAVEQIANITYGRVARVSWGRGCAKRITLCTSCRKLQTIT